MTTIVGLGIVTALFMAIMSMFYLQQIPTKADLERLEDDVRRGHGIYLSAAHPITASLIRPEQDDPGPKTGVRILCTMRQDLRTQPRTVTIYLERIAKGVIEHPDWRGRTAYVTVSHALEPMLEVTLRADEKADVNAAAPAEPKVPPSEVARPPSHGKAPPPPAKAAPPPPAPPKKR